MKFNPLYPVKQIQVKNSGQFETAAVDSQISVGILCWCTEIDQANLLHSIEIRP